MAQERSIEKLVVIGGSAGALSVLFELLPALRPDLGYPLVIVLHRATGGADGGLEALLASKTKLPVYEVEDKAGLRPGHIFLAPPDYHLLFETDGTLSLDDSEKVAHSRPSIDVSFVSAAHAWRARVVGILLSGANTDGVEGLAAIRAAGGQTVVQTPSTAQMPVMPAAAVRQGVADRVETTGGMIAFLNSL